MSRYFSSSGQVSARPISSLKDPVRAATTINSLLTGFPVIDTVVIAEGDRILVKNQTIPSENGIYIAHAGSWTRSSDAAVPSGLIASTLVTIAEGSVNGDSIFMLTTDGPITVGTTPLTFTLYMNASSLVAGAGLTRTGNVFDVNSANTSRIVVNSNDIDLATTGILAGTYTKLTMDIYGRALSATQATTDDISEGTNNLYYTDERVDDRVSALLVAGSNITLIYSDPLNTLTINGPSWQHREVPVGIIDGVNDTFTLAFSPSPAASLMLFKNGLLQMHGVGEDYTIVGNTITFEPGNLPQADFKLVAFYQK